MRLPLLPLAFALLLPLPASARPSGGGGAAAPAPSCQVQVLPTSGYAIPVNAPAFGIASSPSPSGSPRVELLLRGPTATESVQLAAIDFAETRPSDLSTLLYGRIASAPVTALQAGAQYDLAVTATCANVPVQEQHVAITTVASAPLPSRAGELTAETAPDNFTLTLAPSPELAKFLPVTVLTFKANGTRFQEIAGYAASDAPLVVSVLSYLQTQCGGSGAPTNVDVTFDVDAQLIGSTAPISPAQVVTRVDCGALPKPVVTPTPDAGTVGGDDDDDVDVSTPAEDESGCNARPLGARASLLSPLLLAVVLAWRRRRP